VIVVSDTSPITGLLRIGKASLLFQLFGEVVIPEAVRDELLRFHVSLPPELKIRSVPNAPQSLKGLDRGETEAIILAKELRADFLLMDEKDGRAVAIEEGLRPIGLAGIVIAAKRAVLIGSAKELIEELRNAGKVYMSDDLRDEVLRQTNEPPT
jgi:predicted nucleic acid-binding protein